MREQRVSDCTDGYIKSTCGAPQPCIESEWLAFKCLSDEGKHRRPKLQQKNASLLCHDCSPITRFGTG